MSRRPLGDAYVSMLEREDDDDGFDRPDTLGDFMQVLPWFEPPRNLTFKFDEGNVEYRASLFEDCGLSGSDSEPIVDGLCEPHAPMLLDGLTIPWRAAGDDYGYGKPVDDIVYDKGDKGMEKWFRNIRRAMWRFRSTGVTTRRRVPKRSCLPACARQWTEEDVALYILTVGKFDPRIHARIEEAVKSENLVSVVVPTSERRQSWHPLVYDNFRRQSYQPKELIIIDTGEEPSRFFQERSRKDSRVIYRFFKLKDAREDRFKADWLNANGTLATVPSWRRMLEESELGTLEDAWSLGMKRNIACHLARGRYIVQFDDDDMYASDYISIMRRKLADSIEQEVKKRNSPVHEDAYKKGKFAAAATLSEWHMLDLHDMTFRYMDPKTDPDVKEEWRLPMQYGYGFSYIFTRAVWELQPFPDLEFSEDDIWMDHLRKKKVPVELIDLPSGCLGLVAHSFHAENTSGGEFVGDKRLGTIVAPPEAFSQLMPTLHAVIADLFAQYHMAPDNAHSRAHREEKKRQKEERRRAREAEMKRRQAETAQNTNPNLPPGMAWMKDKLGQVDKPRDAMDDKILLDNSNEQDLSSDDSDEDTLGPYAFAKGKGKTKGKGKGKSKGKMKGKSKEAYMLWKGKVKGKGKFGKLGKSAGKGSGKSPGKGPSGPPPEDEEQLDSESLLASEGVVIEEIFDDEEEQAPTRWSGTWRSPVPFPEDGESSGVE